MNEKYGEFLTYGELSSIFKRPESGIRWAVCQGQSDFAETLREARRQFGRRTLFKTEIIEKLVA